MLAVWIALFGGLGAMARFVSDGTLRTVLGRKFPWSTLVINVIGSFILGAITGLMLQGQATHSLILVVGTGFCGGFTTFSTASFEAVRLIEQRRYFSFLVQVIGNVGLCLLAAAIGLSLLH